MEGSESTPTEPAAPTSAPATGAAPLGRRLREGAPDAEAPTTLNQIRYPCLMNMDYHGTREAWLDQLHRWLMFAVIAAGASAFVDAWPHMRTAGPVIAVVCGALDLTFDLSNRARSHAVFRRRFGEVLSRASRSPDTLAECKALLVELAGEEEPAFHAQLALSAMKAQQMTYGRVLDPCRPRWFYRRLANVWRFDGHDFNEDCAASA